MPHNNNVLDVYCRPNCHSGTLLAVGLPSGNESLSGVSKKFINFGRKKVKRMQKGKTLLVLAVVAVLGVGSYAYADWGRGSGRNAGEYGGGYGPGMMGEPEEGCGNWENFSAEDAAKMEKERVAFLAATQKTRQELYAKKLELKAEFLRENPDAEKAARLQKEISELEGQFQQKRIEHMLAVRKAISNAGRGFVGRGMMDYGAAEGAPCGR